MLVYQDYPYLMPLEELLYQNTKVKEQNRIKDGKKRHLDVDEKDGDKETTNKPKVIELKVNLCCEDCARKVRKKVEKLNGELAHMDFLVCGVEKGVICDIYENKVVVKATTNPETVLKQVQKVKKDAEMWPSKEPEKTLPKQAVMQQPGIEDDVYIVKNKERYTDSHLPSLLSGASSHPPSSRACPPSHTSGLPGNHTGQEIAESESYSHSGTAKFASDLEEPMCGAMNPSERRHPWTGWNEVEYLAGSEEQGSLIVMDLGSDDLEELLWSKWKVLFKDPAIHGKHYIQDMLRQRGRVMDTDLELGDAFAKDASFGAARHLVRAPEIRLHKWSLLEKAYYSKFINFGEAWYEVLTRKFPVSRTLPFVGFAGTETDNRAGVVHGDEISIYKSPVEFVDFVSSEGLIHPVYETDDVEVHVDTFSAEPGALQEMDDEAQPSQSMNSPNLLQQHSTEILLGGMPEFVFGVELNILHEQEPARKRIRTRNWSAEEIRTLLELTEEAQREDADLNIWEYVSDNLWEKYDFDRDSKSCRNLWSTLLQSYRAIPAHEWKTRASTKFDMECKERLERILASKPFEEKTRSIQMDGDLPSSALPLGQLQFRAWGMDRCGSEDPEDCDSGDNELYTGAVSKNEAGSTELGSIQDEADLTVTMESQAEVTADSHVADHCNETNSNYAGRKRFADTVVEDDLISRLAPFVYKQVEDTLKPLISALRGREEEQKHREKLLALEEQKLALKRQQILLTQPDNVALAPTHCSEIHRQLGCD